MGKKDQSRLVSAIDKVFPDFTEFEKNAEAYIKRELELFE